MYASLLLRGCDDYLIHCRWWQMGFATLMLTPWTDTTPRVCSRWCSDTKEAVSWKVWVQESPQSRKVGRLTLTVFFDT